MVYPEGALPEPHDQAHDGGERDEDEPEPDEDVDLLVEQVDGQDTLDSVTVDVTQLPDAKITQRFAGESIGRLPVLVLEQTPKDVHPVEVIICAEECVQQEELSDSI